MSSAVDSTEVGVTLGALLSMLREYLEGLTGKLSEPLKDTGN